jgi:hypothetical protein
MVGGKPENPEKSPQSKGENQQQTQLTYDTESGNKDGTHKSSKKPFKHY